VHFAPRGGRRHHGLVGALARTDAVHKLRAERQHACRSATVRQKRAAQLGVPAELGQQAFAMIGAVAVGATAWARLALPNPPETGPGDAARSLFPAAPARDS
jgi:hypothetical protein